MINAFSRREKDGFETVKGTLVTVIMLIQEFH